jgi:hypothetical protein
VIWLLSLLRLLGYDGCLRILVFLFLRRLLFIGAISIARDPVKSLLRIYVLMSITRVHKFDLCCVP